MPEKPIFVATHPRACSTAFERVFMTRRNTLKCIHEPFGDAFYYGPERLSPRFEDDEKARIESGFYNSTFRTIFDRFEREGSEGKRLFIKDIIHYLVPPDGKPVMIAPSLQPRKRGIGTEANGDATNGVSNRPPYPFDTNGELGNPTVVPTELLAKFHFAFLIRDPHSSIPSYYRCTIPPLDKVTGFYEFYPSEAGFDEVRRVFEYLRSAGLVGPRHANDQNNTPNGSAGKSKADAAEICVVDADDLLDDPTGIMQAFCKSVRMKYESEMLNWDTEEDQRYAEEVFSKWPGFHDDALDSSGLKARMHKKKEKSEADWDHEWREKYGEKGAKIIRSTVDRNMEDYLYMKQFALKPTAYS